MDKLTAIKIKYDDGTYSDEIPVSVLSENVEWDGTHTLVDVLGSIDVDVTGTIQDQISQLFNEKVSATQLQNYVASQLNTDVTNWLNTNVNPVGSAVIVDSSLTVSGAAADAKKTGNELTNLKNNINNGDTEISKNIVWQNGYINVYGKIMNSSLSVFALVPLNAGETVKIGTANSNITIIGSTEAESLTVGDTVTVVANTTSSGAFEEYSYQANFDMNIVICVNKSNYTCSFIRQSDFAKRIDEKILDVEEDVFTIAYKKVGSRELSVPIAAAKSKIDVNLSAGEEISFSVKSSSDVITRYYFYINGSSDYIRYRQNQEYFITLNHDTTSVGIFVEPESVVGSGTVEFTVTKVIRNSNSIELKADVAFKASQEYIPHSITDGYVYGHVVENGSFKSNGELTKNVANKIRTALIQFKANDKIVINNGTFVHCCGMWEGTPSASTVKRNDPSFISNDETITPDYDGCIVIVFKKSDDSSIVPVDFDGSILLYNTFAYRNSVSTNSGYSVPDYFLADNYLLNKAKRINELAQNADDVFIFISDIHWERNTRHSPDLIQYLASKCNIPKLFDGGDVADRIIQDAVDKYRNAFNRSIYRTVGNHDWFPPITGKNLYYAFDILNNEQVGNAFNHYYYVDNVQQKIRYVILNAFYHEGDEVGTGWSYYDEEQKNWFSQTALSLPSSDWDVIVFTHFLKTTSYITSGADIGNIIDNFNGQSDHTGKILAVFQGHTHWDGVYHTAGGVPVITITCDKWDLSNETSTIPVEGIAWREENTIKEQAFDVAVLSREARKFTCVRIGAPAQNNIDKYRTDSGFTWIGTLEEREITY